MDWKVFCLLVLALFLVVGYLVIVPTRPKCYRCGLKTRIEWFPGRLPFECGECEKERIKGESHAQ